MYRAGDWVTITEGAGKGRTVEIYAVRMFATDNGYYCRGGLDGLIPPSRVILARERAGGNPCGLDCDERTHQLVGTCDHCRGMCYPHR